MTNFSAKTKDELRGVAQPGNPGDVIPLGDKDALEYLGAGMLYTYRHPKHSYRDFMRPGYFDPVLSQNARSYLGALILFTLGSGKEDQDEWITGIARVIKVKNMQPRGSETRIEHTIIDAWRFPKFTAGTHAGSEEG